jgi:hypothetical protein
METNEEKTAVVCLFCSYQSVNFEDVLTHMVIGHKFDFNGVTTHCDFYQKVSNT